MHNMNVEAYFLINCIIIILTMIQDLEGYCNSELGFECVVSRKCIVKSSVCDGYYDCEYQEDNDISDEENCVYTTSATAVCSGSYLCPTNNTCISYSAICDGTSNCGDGSDESDCSVEKVKNFNDEKIECIRWFLRRRLNGTINKWGQQVHRMAVALYLADKNYFSSDTKIGEEIRYELTVHLLSIFHKREIMRTEQLALYVHAMVVACLNPRDFFNHDLVSDLRKRVDTSKYTNPLAVLVLCNAGANMTAEDVNRLNRTFNSQHRPFWTDVQVLSTMALICIAEKKPALEYDTMLEQWMESLIELQLANGTVGNPRTTALVIQMLLGANYYKGFNWQAAIKAIQVSSFFTSDNFLDKYYLIPVLSSTSPNSIDSSHCSQLSYSADLYRKIKERMNVIHYSVWMDKDIDFGRSWRLRMPNSSSLYDVIEKVHSMESTHTVEYNVVDDKPYVRSVSGVDEDPEAGYYWFTYARTGKSTEDPKLLEESPVDIITRDNQEIILWYRNGVWNSGDIGPTEHS